MYLCVLTILYLCYFFFFCLIKIQLSVSKLTALIKLSFQTIYKPNQNESNLFTFNDIFSSIFVYISAISYIINSDIQIQFQSIFIIPLRFYMYLILDTEITYKMYFAADKWSDKSPRCPLTVQFGGTTVRSIQLFLHS